MGAYIDDRPFSVDLAGSVLRQGSFIDKLHSLSWLSHTSAHLVKHAITRYHAYLDLISSSPDLYAVPTLDIDLAWHTHLLSGWKYVSDCEAWVGRLVDQCVSFLLLLSVNDINIYNIIATTK